MSTTIDQRVVEMRFDNKQFEQNVSTTMSTLDKLKEKLNFKGATQGLEDLRTTSKKIDFSEMEAASYRAGFHISDVFKKVSSVIEYEFAYKIKNAITNTLRDLTITPLTTGFNEYELKMGSIQTIMASTGESLETVNKYLNELNEYSDKTIYSFSDMTSNIGKFTNAGISLDKSVAAIQGVSNVAALSGANANEASRAMYNFSQALSAGYVKLIDWKSIENANMATVGFKEQLLETAVSLGTVTKTSDGMYKTLEGNTFNATKNFNEVLQDQWMTSDVLIQTLGKYSDETTEIGKKATKAATEVKTFSQMMDTLKESAQSGWAQTWEILFGDFEEGKTLWTEINNVVGDFIEKSAEARNEWLDNWDTLGGREALVEGLKNTFQAILSIIKPIKEAFSEIFPPMTFEKAFELTEKFRDFMAGLKLTDEAADNLKRTFKGVFAVFDIFGHIIMSAVKAIGSLFPSVGELGGGILGVTGNIGDFLVKVRDLIKESGIFTKVFQGIADVIKFVIKTVTGLINIISGKFIFPGLEIFGSFLEGISERFTGINKGATTMKERLINTFEAIGTAIANSTFFQVLTRIWDTIVMIGSSIFKAFGNIIGEVANKLSNFGFDDILDLINLIISGGIGVGIWKIVKGIKAFFSEESGLKETLSEICTSVKEVMDSVTGTFKAFQNAINAKALMTIAQAILILAAALVIIAFIPKEELYDSLTAIGILFAGLVASMITLSKFTKVGGTAKIAGAITSIAFAVLILSIALKSMSGMNMKEVATGLIGVLGLVSIIVGALKILSANDKTIIKGSATMVAMAVAVTILVSACKKLAKLDFGQMMKGLLGVAALLGALALACKLLNGTKGSALVILGLALAVKILVGVMKSFAAMSNEDLLKGTAAIYALVVAFGILAFAMKQVSSGKIATTAASLIIIGIALGVFVTSINALSLISWEGLGKAGAAIGGLVIALGALAAITHLLKPGRFAAISASLIILGVAFGVFIASIYALTLVPWSSLGKAGVAIAGLVVAITTLAAIGKIINVSDILKMAGALAILGGALIICTASMLALTFIPWSSLGKAGAAIAGLVVTLAALAGVSKLISVKDLITMTTMVMVLSWTMLKLSAAFAIFSIVSWAGVAKGLVALAGAFIILGVAGLLLKPLSGTIFLLSLSLIKASTGILIICASIGVLGVALAILAGGLTALGAALPVFVGGLLSALGMLVVGTAKMLTSLGEALIELGIMLCDVFIKLAPSLGKAIAAFVVMICDVLIECAPKIVDTILIILDELLKSLAKFIPSMAKSILELLVGVIEALVQYVPTIVGLLLELVVNVINEIASNIGPIIKAVFNLVMSVFQGVIDALCSLDSGVLLGGLLGIGLIAAILVAVSALGSLVPGAMIALLQIAGFVAELAILVAAFGALAQIPGLAWLIEQGGNFLGAIGTAIGQFIGGIVGGIAKGFSASLPQIGTDLSNFMTNLKPFIDGVNLIKPGAMDSVKSLASMILTLTAANILDGLTAWFTGGSSVDKFATELPILGRGLKGFSDATTGINTENIVAASNAAKALAEMCDHIPNEGGVVGWFAGENSIAKFGSELPMLGMGLKGFSDAVNGVTPENITSAANAAKALAEMTGNIPDQGGVAAWFAGENSIAKFGTELPILGMGLKGFSDAVNGINPENVTASANAAKALAEMTQHIPKEGGIKAWFTGETSVSNFANKLPTLGKGMKGFSDSVEGIVPENVTAAASAAKSLAQMTDIVPKDTGKIITFGENLVTFGGKLSGYFEATSGITAEATSASKSALDAVKEAAAIEPGNLKALGTAVKDAAESMKKLSSVPKDCASNFTNALDDLGKSSTKTFINAFDGLDEDLKKKAKAGMDGFIDGIEGKESAATKACKAVVSACAEAVSEKTSSFESAGKSICQGLADGINNNSTIATQAAKAMAKAAAAAAKEALDINSPSKIFRSIGYSVPEGFAMGIDKLSGMVEKSSVEMTNESVNSVRNSISRIADVINSDIDAQPTIRPVLDLSDVRAGANSIGSMFASGSIGVLTNVGSISGMMNRRSQNGANADVIKALDKIGKDIKDMDRTTYNFGGISYTEGDDVAAAFETIIRAARVERRK